MSTDITQKESGSTQSSAPKQTTPTDDVGFRPVPTRITDLAPLVVDEPSAEQRAQVVDVLEELGSKLGNVHRTAAEAYLSQAMYEAALPHLEAAAQFAPDVLEFHNQVGFVRYLTGNDQGAVDAFEKVLSRDPSQIDAHFNLGMVLFGRSEFLAAAACFDKVIALSPDDPEAWNNKGTALFEGGQRQQAKQCFSRALEIDPANEDARANMAAC